MGFRARGQCTRSVRLNVKAADVALALLFLSVPYAEPGGDEAGRAEEDGVASSAMSVSRCHCVFRVPCYRSYVT